MYTNNVMAAMSSSSHSKRSAKDPCAPKRNLSAYLLYQNAMRDQFKAQNPGMTFGQLSKFTSAMYAEMSPQEKAEWRARAEADKARYLADLAIYVPPPGYDAKGDAIDHTGKKVTRKNKRSKTERDPNAPKRNMSAYLLYQNAMRDQFKRDNPGMTFGQLSKYTSHMYKNMTVEERAEWDNRAVMDKRRFGEQMAQYQPPPGYDEKGLLILISTNDNGGGVALPKQQQQQQQKQAKLSHTMNMTMNVNMNVNTIQQQHQDVGNTLYHPQQQPAQVMPKCEAGAAGTNSHMSSLLLTHTQQTQHHPLDLSNNVNLGLGLGNNNTNNNNSGTTNNVNLGGLGGAAMNLHHSTNPVNNNNNNNTSQQQQMHTTVSNQQHHHPTATNNHHHHANVNHPDPLSRFVTATTGPHHHHHHHHLAGPAMSLASHAGISLQQPGSAAPSSQGQGQGPSNNHHYSNNNNTNHVNLMTSSMNIHSLGAATSTATMPPPAGVSHHHQGGGGAVVVDHNHHPSSSSAIHQHHNNNHNHVSSVSPLDGGGSTMLAHQVQVLEQQQQQYPGVGGGGAAVSAVPTQMHHHHQIHPHHNNVHLHDV